MLHWFVFAAGGGSNKTHNISAIHCEDAAKDLLF